jgi:redox-sensitive bicupin YhaK (pirin superfamily)
MNAATNNATSASVLHPRAIEQVIAGRPTSDGAGVKLTRVLGQSLHSRLDPFLMLDAFGSDSPQDYIAGFPDHPHRGFETVTYLIAGRMRHRDSAGHEGLLLSGGVQWMTAGRGVIHSEMPEQEQGVMEGFQLWLNLPARDKMTSPWYSDFQSADIPEFVTADGVKARVIAGASHGVAGAVQKPTTEPLFVDLHLPANSRFAQPLPPGHNAFVYVYRGTVGLGGHSVPEQRLAILSNSASADGVVVETQTASRLLLVAGKPLGEPIVQQGPFVMNTQEEIAQAMNDFRSGRLT